MLRVIKKYSNRRLYDTIARKMVNLSDVASLIKKGESFKVVEDKTGRDLTDVTLVQIVFEKIKKSKKLICSDVFMKELIKTGRLTAGNFLKTSLQSSIEMLSSAERRTKGMVCKREDLEEIKDKIEALNRKIDMLLARAVYEIEDSPVS